MQLAATAGGVGLPVGALESLVPAAGPHKLTHTQKKVIAAFLEGESLTFERQSISLTRQHGALCIWKRGCKLKARKGSLFPPQILRDAE